MKFEKDYLGLLHADKWSHVHLWTLGLFSLVSAMTMDEIPGRYRMYIRRNRGYNLGLYLWLNPQIFLYVTFIFALSQTIPIFLRQKQQTVVYSALSYYLLCLYMGFLFILLVTWGGTSTSGRGKGGTQSLSFSGLYSLCPFVHKSFLLWSWRLWRLCSCILFIYLIHQNMFPQISSISIPLFCCIKNISEFTQLHN